MDSISRHILMASGGERGYKFPGDIVYTGDISASSYVGFSPDGRFIYIRGNTLNAPFVFYYFQGGEIGEDPVLTTLSSNGVLDWSYDSKTLILSRGDNISRALAINHFEVEGEDIVHANTYSIGGSGNVSIRGIKFLPNSNNEFMVVEVARIQKYGKEEGVFKPLYGGNALTIPEYLSGALNNSMDISPDGEHIAIGMSPGTQNSNMSVCILRDLGTSAEGIWQYNTFLDSSLEAIRVKYVGTGEYLLVLGSSFSPRYYRREGDTYTYVQTQGQMYTSWMANFLDESPDKKTIALSSTNGLYTQNNLRFIYSDPSLPVPYKIDEHGEDIFPNRRVRSVCFSPDGKYLAAITNTSGGIYNLIIMEGS